MDSRNMCTATEMKYAGFPLLFSIASKMWQLHIRSQLDRWIISPIGRVNQFGLESDSLLLEYSLQN